MGLVLSPANLDAGIGKGEERIAEPIVALLLEFSLSALAVEIERTLPGKVESDFVPGNYAIFPSGSEGHSGEHRATVLAAHIEASLVLRSG